MLDSDGYEIPTLSESGEFGDEIATMMDVWSESKIKFDAYIDQLEKDILVEYDDGSIAVLNPSEDDS